MRNITGIRQHISKMKQLDPKYHSFIANVEKMTKDYQFMRIIDLISPYIIYNVNMTEIQCLFWLHFEIPIHYI
jgi:hypothetical protein